MLTEFEDRLSIIQRWSLARTINKQTVMDHTARVARMALKILDRYGSSKTTREEVLLWALHHDDLEGFCGDFPSTVKDCVDEIILFERYRYFMSEYAYPNNYNEATKKIVKIADVLDCMLFCGMEESMGNLSLSDELNRNYEKARNIALDLSHRLYDDIAEWYEQCKLRQFSALWHLVPSANKPTESTDNSDIPF